MNNSKPVITSIAVFISLALVPVQGISQSDGAMLEEIIVTARKRAESMQDAPVTITAFSKDSLELYNTDTMEDLASLTPGLMIGEAISPSGAIISLRGVSTGSGNPSFDQAIAIVMDGVPMNHSALVRTSQWDNQQIEVYKGPQALFYGKNSPGGVISFQSADPGEEFEASLRVGYEFNADESFGEAVISGPISDTLSGRLVAVGTMMDGWLDNKADEAEALGFGTASDRSKLPERDEYFIRGTLVFEPSDRVRMRTKVSYYEEEGSPYQAVTPLVSCPGGLDSAGFRCEPQTDFNFEQQNNQDVIDAAPRINSVNPIREQEWLQISHQMDFDVTDAIQVTSVTGYMDFDSAWETDVVTGPIADALSVYNALFMETFSQELRLATSFDSPVNFTAGAYYGNGDNVSVIEAYLQLGPAFILPLQPTDPFYTVDTETVSLFGELIWDLSDTLEFSVGVRWTDESKDFQPEENGVRVPNVNSELDFRNTSPEASLTWRPTDNSIYFISYKEGFKSGGHNTTLVVFGIAGVATPENPFDVSYEEETVEGWELGAKWELLDGRLRLNTAAFHYEFTDMQLSSFDAESLAQRIFNAGKSTVQGAEVDILYLTGIEGLTVNLGVAYTDAGFDEFFSGCWGGQTEAEGCLPKPGFPGVFEQDHAGRQLPYAPEWNGSAGFTYERKLTDEWSLSSALSLEFSDSYFTQQELLDATAQDSYTRVNANVSLNLNDKWEFSLIGVNLTDEAVRGASGDANTNPVRTRFSSIGRGRQVSLQAKWTF